MKYITAEEEIHITHWAYAMNGRLLSIIYEKDGEHERHVKFLHPTPQLDDCLLEHLQARISVNALNAVGADWVDENPHFEKGIEIPIEVDDEFMRFCAQNGVSVSEYLYGLSCYLCNPANCDRILAYLSEFVLQVKAEMTDDEKFDAAARRVLERHKPAFSELVKGE